MFARPDIARTRDSARASVAIADGEHLKRQGVLTGVLLAGLGALVWLSFRLSVTRILQVDECQVVFVARVLATGQTNAFFSGVSPFLALLGWLGHNTMRSIDVFDSARMLMVAVFWLNLCLMALATGERLLSGRGLAALAGAATLAPLWDYGFEIRNDNLLLAGVLLTWYIVRVRPAGIRSYIIAGMIAMALQFSLFKAFVYTVPISLAILSLPPPACRVSRWKLLLAWMSGAAIVVVALRTAYGLAGLWGLYLSDFHRVAGDASGQSRFGPWQTLSRLLGQAPLLLAVAAAALAAFAADLKRRGTTLLSWSGSLPEVLLVAVVFTALCINPTPFPYNLLHFVPYLYVLAFRHAVEVWKEVWSRAALRPLLVTVVLFVHLVPFGVATARHCRFTNARQAELMCLAEELTAPARDCVYDGVGMVPSRASIHHDWFLHSFNIRKFTQGHGPSVRDMLAARPAAVVIPNYRTDWLSEEDHAFVRGRYVPLADDFWVLGKVLPAGGGTFHVVYPGRYRVSSLQESGVVETRRASAAHLPFPSDEAIFTATLDGAPMSGRPVELAVGTHRIECKPGWQPAVVWVGPKLDRVGRLSQGDHRLLFVNWY
jgi:hypothetical protein